MTKKLTTEEFVEKAVAVHGNKYTYDKSTYTGNKGILTATCSLHGDFTITPDKHISGKIGCIVCAAERMLREAGQRFQENAGALHQGKYDYSMVVYNGSRSRVEVKCNADKSHSSFWVTPSKHLSNGAGCPTCSNRGSKTTEGFRKDCMDVHGDRYNYEKSVYAGVHTKVIVTCRVHGDFEIIPASHRSGAGCAACAGNYLGTTENFIQDAKVVHGEKYVYTAVEYKSSTSKVEISCNTCKKTFWQTPASHLRTKIGCPNCAKQWIPTTEEYIASCQEKHGDRYTYGNTVYSTSSSKVSITCGEHGEFTMLAKAHKKGQVCPNCSTSGSMGTAECRLYVLTNKDTTKIGITIRSVKERMQQINRNSGKGFQERFSVLLDNSRTARGLEQAMLKCLRSRYRQPIEVFDGSTESFYDVDLSSLVAQITERSIILTDNPEVLIIENN